MKKQETLRYLWQLPQHLLALILLAGLRGRIVRRDRAGAGRVYYCFTAYGGVSLGEYLFVHREANAALVRHELGHCRQSMLLGPLYLLVIGLPSLLWAALFPAIQRRRPYADYFDFFTERWANTLAGVEVVDEQAVPGQEPKSRRSRRP